MRKQGVNYHGVSVWRPKVAKYVVFNTETTCMKTKGYLECSMTKETRDHQFNVCMKMETRGHLMSFYKMEI